MQTRGRPRKLVYPEDRTTARGIPTDYIKTLYRMYPYGRLTESKLILLRRWYQIEEEKEVVARI